MYGRSFERGNEMKRAFCKAAGLVLLVGLAGCAATDAGNKQNKWRDTFTPDKANLSDTGRNMHFILEAGYTLNFSHGKNTLVITVLDETKIVDGVKTRVVEERERQDGRLTEVSRNYFAIDRSTGDVYYFGEDVDTYKQGKIAGHEGVWLSGVGGARFGLMMPGKPKAGDRFYQEIAPDAAMDRAEIVGVSDKVETTAGTFRDCVHFRESSAIEKGVDHKWFAPGVGLIKDGDLLLVKIGR